MYSDPVSSLMEYIRCELAYYVRIGELQGHKEEFRLLLAAI